MKSEEIRWYCSSCGKERVTPFNQPRVGDRGFNWTVCNVFCLEEIRLRCAKAVIGTLHDSITKE